MNFIRRFRLETLNKKKVGRYLLYAMGEIVLVVVGILIAIRIDGWNQENKDRAQEQRILKQLKKEYEANLLQLTEKIQMRNKIIGSAFRILRLTDGSPLVNPDSIAIELSLLMRDPTFDPVKNDIVGTSNLQFIQNDSLRLLLSNWGSDVYQLQEIELQWQKVRTETILPFTIESGLSRSMHDNIWKNGYAPVHALDKNSKETFLIGKSKNSSGVDRTLVESRLEGIASTAITMNQIGNMQSAALEKHILTIIALVQSEIK